MQPEPTRGNPSPGRRRSGRRWPHFVLAGLLLASALSGASLGYFMRFNLPDVRALEDYRPPTMTRVLASDGSLIDTFAEQRRILINYEDIPVVFRNALLATEDSGFYRHTGIDLKGIARAAWRDVTRLQLAQGASTLTQQLARNLFLHRDKTFRRKIQEALLAVEIERQYTKEEILRFYCNQVYMGHGRYGLEAASRYYFDVPARELTLGQAATLAGLLQRPESLSPLRHPERAQARRNYVLRRMVATGHLDPEEAAAVRQLSLELPQRKTTSDLAPYFVEEVRRWLQDRYGSSSVYTAGLSARTTLDPRLQAIANEALEAGLRGLDKRQGWRGVTERVPDDADPLSWESPSWDREIEPGGVYEAVVVAVDKSAAAVRLADLAGRLGPDEIKWTGQKNPAKLFKVGDRVQVRAVKLGEDGSVRLALEQEPEVEAAIVALDPTRGSVLAMVGGFDFERSEFNRAIQASRQTGSAFKPFVYAAALASGWTLADLLHDVPTVFLDPRKPEPYQPENFSNKYYGTLTLRTALERSANIATVRLLDRIGYEPVIETARKLGISSRLRPFASLALGAFETRLLELTAAYGALANQGVLVQPHLIEEVRDQDEVLIYRVEPTVTEAVSPQVAYLMNRLLAGVITDGTGRSAAGLKLNLAGKTGTTDDSTDAWFLGYGPDLAVGVWVGFDERRSLGKLETGASAALPIWRVFMEQALAGRPARPLPMPSGTTLVAIDRRTGLKANPQAYCHPVITEAFIAGTEPTESCSVYQHQRLRLPYSLQRYALSESGELLIPAADLDRLLAREPSAWIVDGGRRLEVHLPTEVVSMPIRILDSPEGPEPPPDPRLADFDTETWVGRDGRPAEVVWIDGRPQYRASKN